MKKLVLASVVLFLTACQSLSGDVRLAWADLGPESLEYETVNTEVAVYKPLMISGFDVLEDQEKRREIKRELKSLDLPDATFITQLWSQDDFLRVAVTGIEPDPNDGSPETPEAKYEREKIRHNAGKVVLLGDFSKENGRLLSFFLEEKQRSLLNLLFALPDQQLSPGDSWELDVKGIELAAGFIPEHARRESKGFLEDLERDADGRLIATLFYVVSEEFDGHFLFRKPEGTEEIPLNVEHTYFALGRFLPEEGRWLDFTAIGGNKVTSTSYEESLRVYSLREPKTGPR
ncbi:hypothetical protein [uncultured Marinobacter sp.]|uniref:hypothetical protein n=1 Tax=uncultured Marinobacter sp. TaxID=187379 RepID=UPI0030DC0BDA